VKNNKAGVASKLFLEQNYPNPFNSSTTIKYSLAKPNYMSIRIYNLIGQEMKTLIDGYQTAGIHEIKWTAEGFPSGIYFYKLQSGGFSETRKLIIKK
ncbi:MAG: T9SS type A sorting domain-containing protein, partial [bacterium]